MTPSGFDLGTLVGQIVGGVISLLALASYLQIYQWTKETRELAERQSAALEEILRTLRSPAPAADQKG